MTVEKIQNWRKRLIFRSWHRGTREMDLLMGSFADKNVPEFTEAELQDYEELLEFSDPDLYNWVSGREEVPEDVNSPLMKKLVGYQYKAL